jgi:hypothetical protein
MEAPISSTGILQSCKCGFICIANSHPEAHDLYLQHIFEATTEDHEINREMAVSVPITNLAELRTHIEVLNRCDCLRAVENDVFHHADSMVIDSEDKLAKLCINALGVCIIAGLLVWDLWKAL